MRIRPPNPKARRLLGVIAEEISRGGIRVGRPWTFLSYSAALEKLGEDKAHFRSSTRLRKLGLDDLNDWTREFVELPKVTALIVDKNKQRPNPRFAESHGITTEGTAWLDWWMDQADRSIRYDWSPYVENVGEQLHSSGEEMNVAENTPPLALDAQEILRWFAAGQTEADILREHPDLTAAEIRASLARAASQLKKLDRQTPDADAPSTLAQRWAGKFTLPEDDPSDPRLTYLLERYRRHRG